MKRVVALFIAAAMLVSLSGCLVGEESGVIKSYVAQIKDYLTPGVDWDNEPVYELKDIGGKTKYYFNQLTNREKHAYNNVLSQVDELPIKIEIPELDSESLSTVLEALLFDNPLLLQLGRTCNIITVGSRSYFNTNYILTANELQIQKREVLKAANKILGGISENMSDFKKELLIHDRIIENCSYKHEGVHNENTVYGALVNGKAACEGYAKAAKLLFDMCAIDAYVIGGQAKNPQGKYEGHMWNVVKINGNYYNLDLTWDDPISQENTDESRYTYFNLTDDDISKTHSDFKSVNPCTANAENYYIKRDLYFKDYNSETQTIIAERISQAVNEGESSIELRFSSEKLYDAAFKGLFTDEQIYRILTVSNLSAVKKLHTTETSYIRNDDYNVIEIIFIFK